MISFALGIPHTPWVAERRKSLARLAKSLNLYPLNEGDCALTYGYQRVFKDREPNWSWSCKLWCWGYESGASHLLQLQDDVIVGNDFWTHLRSMVEAVPDQIIGLESVLAIGSPWYTTGDGLIGVGYVIPRDVLEDFLDWRSHDLRPGSVERLNEDQLIGLFCFVTGRKVWHPCPTIIDHDALPSTYGNDHHMHRRPVKSTVRGDATPASWTPQAEVMHVRRFYQATPALARQHVKGYSFERYVKDCQ